MRLCAKINKQKLSPETTQKTGQILKSQTIRKIITV